MYVSSPSRKTMARKPSHLGSNSQPSSAGCRRRAWPASARAVAGRAGAFTRDYTDAPTSCRRVVASVVECQIERFRGDPYPSWSSVTTSTNTQIKRRWRELAREHHPDRAAGTREEAARLTTRMARINAAYDLLRDPVRRGAFDSSPAGRRARAESGFGRGDVEFDDVDAGRRPAGLRHRRARQPVTARFDTTTAFRPRNSTSGDAPRTAARPPAARRGADAEERDLRASTPTGPVERRAGKRGIPMPDAQRGARDGAQLREVTTATRSARSSSSIRRTSTGSRARSRATGTWSSGRVLIRSGTDDRPVG